MPTTLHRQPRSTLKPPVLPLQVLLGTLICDAEGRILADTREAEAGSPVERGKLAVWLVERVSAAAVGPASLPVHPRVVVLPANCRSRAVYNLDTGEKIADSPTEAAARLGVKVPSIFDRCRVGRPFRKQNLRITFEPPAAIAGEMGK